MSRSLFGRYFLTCVVLILICIIFLGVVLFGFSSQYFRVEKENMLSEHVKSAAKLTDDIFAENNYAPPQASDLQTLFQIMSSAIDADVYMTGTDGVVWVCSEVECNHRSHKVSAHILQQIKEKREFTATGSMEAFLPGESYYTVGVPVLNGSGAVYGYLFASASTASLDLFMSEIAKMFLVAAAVVIMIACVILYFTTDKLVRPLRQMSALAKKLGKGDFSAAVPVNGYDEVSQLAMSLNNMASELATLEKTRSSFIANISHDLRTPMTTIGGFIGGILDGTIPPERQSHYLHIVSDEVGRLSKLVKVMMNIAKIEAGEVHISRTKFDVVETICKIMFTFEQKIDQKHLDIRGLEQPKVWVDADPDLIGQVLYNLIDNAVKFVDQDGYIEFGFVQEQEMAYVSITNSGAGIKKESLAKIFDRFYKADESRGIDKTGVGLGLYIVKSVINAHGGDIIVRSTENQYCTFSFSLPLWRNQG